MAALATKSDPKDRERHVASLGAIVAIASIAVGPFTQQILATSFRMIETDVKAATMVYRAVDYDTFTVLNQQDQLMQNGMSTSPTLEMQAAIMSGILAKSIDIVAAVCPTGNCTWPRQSSLAVCGGCKPIQPLIERNGTTSAYVQDNPKYVVNSTVSYPMLVWPVQGNNASLGLDPRTNFRSKALHYAHPTKPYLTVFQSVTARRNETAPDPFSFSGEECALWFCVQAYDTSVRNGEQQHRTVATYDDYLPDPPESIPWMGDRRLKRPTWRLPNNYSIRVADHAAFNLDAASNTAMNITSASIQAISTELNSHFQGSYMARKVDRPFTISGGVVGDELHISSNVIFALQSFGAETVIQKLATSMTNHVRSARSQSAVQASSDIDRNATTVNDRYIGTAYLSEPFFQVRWAWITLPLLLVLASPVFLGLTMWRTCETETPVLGSGIMALLGCCVDERIRDAFVGLAREDEVKNKAKTVTVEFESSKEHTGWEVKYKHKRA